jgi:acetoin utilization deacetylase AcuC-like enzyme
MQVLFAEAQRAHAPQAFLVAGVFQPSPETPARIDALMQGVARLGLQVAAPPDLGLAPAAAVHSPDYLEFLETIHARWQRIEGAGPAVIPNVHPRTRSDGRPASPVGLAGWHMADTACPIGPDTWASALASSHSAAAAADRVIEGWPAAYALCRPPGHHAFADQAGGFCFLNNTAIAAQRLRRRFARVAVLDVDLHHGNGTQAIFYARGDVLTVSLHADPAGFYPFFWGHAGERGEDAGLGCNLNLPLSRGTGDAGVLAALDRARRRLDAFAPDALVVALGLDAHEDDPLAGLAVTTPGFHQIGRAVAGIALPTVLVQEGGYPSPCLADNLAAFLEGFLG